MEISIDEFDEIRNAAKVINSRYKDHCACCHADFDIIDRGVPLCDYHMNKQDKINSKRPKLFITKPVWDETDVMQIMFR